MLSKEENRIVTLAEKAYVTIMGRKKWNSLTDRQKHDAVMIMVNDMTFRINFLRLKIMVTEDGTKPCTSH